MRVVLGYSGGLDTSVIVPWLRENYGAEVICMAADVGQRGGLEGLESKALSTGAHAFYGEDLRSEFVESYIWPTLRAGAVYARKYLLGTAMARPVIAKRQVEVARRVDADALAHGCTGKGNDQVRFELTYQALAPDLRVVAPWREWSIRSREDALAYAEARNIHVDVDPTKLYSRDENVWHMSHEGGPLEDPAFEPEEEMYVLTRAAEDAPDHAAYVEIGFESGNPTHIDGTAYAPLAMLEALNDLAGLHGIGRSDIVEDRLVGMKSRGVYETPGGTVLYQALQELEQFTLHRRSLRLKDELALKYADLVYEGRWWTPEREALDAMVTTLLEPTTGSVRLKLYKGSARVMGRKSANSLYDEGLATFEESTSFDHADASGFIRLFGLPLRQIGTTPVPARPASARANGTAAKSAKSAKAEGVLGG